MKKLLLIFLFVSGWFFGQTIEKDSVTTSGRYSEFKLGSNKLTIETDYPIKPFTLLNGVLTSPGDPYFGIQFSELEVNTNVTLQDIFHSESFKKDFPNSEIFFDGVHRIRSADYKDGVLTQVNIYAVKGGLLWLFLKVKDAEATAKEKVSRFLAFTKLQQNHYKN